ncbi:DUF934 domain-containing protein [Pokkaliibacter sp. MBI-7]|uniref:DUF934 domain-containing protein n=1 Tax=Pokkaliibacter sp. MBI-7 TaxID=3040600 RepID=UPI00244B045E|nr:DUF934 domain-containing protein [Pokkaliibacter sp. MBI-7]MDH2435279.1 DUF934 domain-containing protein [Pokkaliibacter sp. MBI-7]
MNNLIRLHQGQALLVEDDPWRWIQTSAGADEAVSAGEQHLLLPLADWLRLQPERVCQGKAISDHGIWLAADNEPEQLQPWLAVLPLIALDFPSFRDGRAYSHAYMLRTRLGWQGELRAIGDVLRDQLSHMRHCGMDAFAIRDDKSAAEALPGLNGISVLYGRSVAVPVPLFRRRHSSDHAQPDHSEQPAHDLR